jgi:hypothetical protein
MGFRAFSDAAKPSLYGVPGPLQVAVAIVPVPLVWYSKTRWSGVAVTVTATAPAVAEAVNGAHVFGATQAHVGI